MDNKGLLVRAAAERRVYAAPSQRHVRAWIRLLMAFALVGTATFLILQPGRLAQTAALNLSLGSEALASLAQEPLVHQGDESSSERPNNHGGSDSSLTAASAENLVPLEAHIMSKCPDAKDCIQALVLPTMQVVSHMVNFTLSYVGKLTSDGGVECMHGPGECMGNILELCAQELYPDPMHFLGFSWCLTKNYWKIPERSLVQDCALEHAIDLDKLDECATRDGGQYAMNLLQASVKHTAAVGVSKSCTVRLQDKIYCIRDDGEWKDCPAGPGVNDLILHVKKLYRRE